MESRAKQEARSFLLEHKVRRLPVDIKAIVKYLGIVLLSYDAAGAVIKELGLMEYCSYPSFSIHTKRGNYIFYDASLCPEALRFCIAHELGHFRLHFSEEGIHGFASTIEEQQRMEEEANEFARNVLAPLPLLDALEVRSAEDVETKTGLNREEARVVYRALCNYRSVQKTSRECKKLSIQFGFMTVQAKLKKHRTLFAVLLTLVICLVTILLFKTPLLTNRESSSPSEITQSPSIHSVSDLPVATSSPCFWTESGTVYHLYRDCQYLKNSRVVFSGNSSEAEKERVCEICRRRALE